MANTSNLQLPLLAASQAQKHVTYNEAMELLDTLFPGATSIKRVSEELTAMSGAAVTTTAVMPEGSVLLGVSLIVIEEVTGATSFDVGDGSTVDKFGTGVDVALDTIHKGAVVPEVLSSDTTVTLTSIGGNFTGGSVRVSLHYIDLVPA